MIRILATGLLCVALSSAHAFEVILDGTGTNATGITRLEICAGGGAGCGEYWDIEFEFGNDHDGVPFDSRDIYTNQGDVAGAINAADTINAALGTSAALTVNGGDRYFIPYLYDDSSCAQPGSGTCAALGDGFFGWGGLPASDAEISLTSPIEIAKFTQVVPVPPAVWLFGSALGLLGWVRHRSRRTQSS